MNLFKHPITWFVIGASALVVGIIIDVRTLSDPAGLVLSVIFVISLIMGILTGTGIIYKK